MEKNIYTSLCTDEEFIPGLICLNYMLQKYNSKYGFEPIITSNVSKDELKKLDDLNIKYHIFPIKFFQTNWSYYDCTINKLYVYELYEYDKVCFLDSDIILYENIDEYFNYLNDKNEFLISSYDWEPTENSKMMGAWFLTYPKKGKGYEFIEKFKQWKHIGDEQVFEALYWGSNKFKWIPYIDGSIMDHWTGIPKYWNFYRLKTNEDYFNFINNPNLQNFVINRHRAHEFNLLNAMSKEEEKKFTQRYFDKQWELYQNYK